jgi:hypothetical protein
LQVIHVLGSDTIVRGHLDMLLRVNNIQRFSKNYHFK